MNAAKVDRTDVRVAELEGRDLGAHEVSYDERDTILYALAVGAPADRLDLVYERDLRSLPSMACAFGLWAVEACGRLGAYDPHSSLHATQRLTVHRELPTSGVIPMTGRVVHVWDKGRAAMVDIDVQSEFFTAGYTIFLPGLGGWGGQRGVSAAPASGVSHDWSEDLPTDPRLAALYRLTGDRHPVHIDPDVAAANGFERPILHGLCTLGIAARAAAGAVGAHPGDLRQLEARLTAPVLPGDTIHVEAGNDGSAVDFTATVADRAVLSGGRATYHPW